MQRLYQKLPTCKRAFTRSISNGKYYLEAATSSNFKVKGILDVTGSDSEKVLTFHAQGLPDIVPSSGTVIAKRSGNDKHGQLMPTSASAGPISLLGPFPTANYASDKGKYDVDASVAVALFINQQGFWNRGAMKLIKDALGISDNEQVKGKLIPKK